MPLLNAPFNNFSVTKKMLIEPISIEEAINNDYYDNLTQNEKNLLIERKFDAIKHLPFQFNNNLTEQYLAKTFNTIQQHYETNFDFDINDETIPNLCGNRIDALWTFVNSSDKNWRELFNKYNETFKPNRFKEIGELKYHLKFHLLLIIK